MTRKPRKRRMLAYAGGLLVLIAAGAAYVLWPQRDPLEALLRKYEFVVLRPPSTLYPPGTIVQITQKSPLVIDVICTQKAALGDDVRVDSSRTSNSDLIQRVSRTFNLNSEALGGALSTKPEFKAVRRARLTLSNATISQLSADRVVAHVADRKPECSGAIANYLKAGHILSMISATLRADVLLAVEFGTDMNLTVEQKQELLKDLSTTVGFGYSRADTSYTTAEGLDWGFRENARWATLTSDTTFALAAMTDTGLSRTLQRLADSVQRTSGVDSRAAYAKAVVAVVHDTAMASRPIAEQGSVAVSADRYFSSATGTDNWDQFDKQMREALLRYEAEARRHPDNALDLVNLGTTQNRLGRYEDALASLRKAIALDPTRDRAHAWWYNELCVALKRLGREEQADGPCAEAIQLDPGNARFQRKLQADLTAAEQARRVRAPR